MRPTFGAAKVGKTAHAAKAPGKLRRVPCVSRIERPVPNSLPSVAQTCGTGLPRSLLRYSAPSRQMGGRRTLGACQRKGLRAFGVRSPPSPPPSIAGRAGKRVAACLSDGSEATIASSADPGPTETRREPGRRTGGVARQRFLVIFWGAKKSLASAREASGETAFAFKARE